MASQVDFLSLDELCLLHHGDAIERFYWPKVASSLSEYEVFWKRFIVLLTNRIDPLEYKEWIMLRKGLGEEYESLLMANYTTFYHCVVAHEQIEIGRAHSITRNCSSSLPTPVSKVTRLFRRKLEHCCVAGA